jgi:HNH endonuclease
MDAEIDFINFGVLPNEALLAKVNEVLKDIHLYADIDRQSALFFLPRVPTDPLIDSFRLLVGYKRIWRRRRGGSFFRASSVDNPMQALLQSRTAVEAAAVDSVLCQTALEIIQEHDTYFWHREQVNKHKAVQRRILGRNYDKFFDALVFRDGKRCTDCQSKRKKLLIDHIRPVSLGGLTELINLQLLCFSCNSKKGNTF